MPAACDEVMDCFWSPLGDLGPHVLPGHVHHGGLADVAGHLHLHVWDLLGQDLPQDDAKAVNVCGEVVVLVQQDLSAAKGKHKLQTAEHALCDLLIQQIIPMREKH
eukprot:scaffold80042_cov34-Prasinocladus_malaysianus.AAC.1